MVAPTDDTLRNATLQALQHLGDDAPAAHVDEEVARRLGLAADERAALRQRLARVRARLKAAGLVTNRTRGRWSLTAQGRAAIAPGVADAGTPPVSASAASPAPGGGQPPGGTAPALVRVGTGHLGASVISGAFSPVYRAKLGLPTDDTTPMSVIVELNVRQARGLAGADERLRMIYRKTLGHDAAWDRERLAETYYRLDLSMQKMRDLVNNDLTEPDPAAPGNADDKDGPRRRAIFRIWPDFPVRRLTDHSVATVKGDAALRSYNASGAEIAWGVIDSGIDATHPHFRTYDTLGGDTAQLHRDFTGTDPAAPIADHVKAALTDKFGHGTHVAGIIAGGMPPQDPPGTNLATFKVGQRLAADSPTTDAEEMSDLEEVQEREVRDQARLTGVAPRCRLVSLKVLGDDGESKSSDVIRALAYVRENANGDGRLLRIHGVNLSLGYEFNAKWFACGQSPLCVEVDKLARTGVVVVVAAGNTGYGELSSTAGPTGVGLSHTINDPGNAALAITVGATHRDSPYTYGVSYFSSKGPTGDGRQKPDLVAPGERITSCAAGKNRDLLGPLYGGAVPPCAPAYIDDSGTSMAAPHVSGAIAAFLSIRREFIGQPERVKQLFLENATPLGRDTAFEGHGLVDLMRTIQAV